MLTYPQYMSTIYITNPTPYALQKRGLLIQIKKSNKYEKHKVDPILYEPYYSLK
ncbi:hypothetical protein GCM10007111_27320 [Virgibacillus kapii]|uniref:Uncharacterized protein n=1 Tax=Virgibacillus kapii TaxID=1638645 RepID=A0ABQ2DQJ8_9BACI|nr:hypothetical protein GCM10007111_27320 [Virgibacillus kapii]